MDGRKGGSAGERMWEVRRVEKEIGDLVSGREGRSSQSDSYGPLSHLRPPPSLPHFSLASLPPASLSLLRLKHKCFRNKQKILLRPSPKKRQLDPDKHIFFTLPLPTIPSLAILFLSKNKMKLLFSR